jgi:hypothetical protein
VKIIKGSEFSDSPIPWWVDLLMECEYCKAQLTLEAGDPVEVLEDAESPDHDIVQLDCPTCQRLITCSRSSAHESKLPQDSSDTQPEAVEKLEMAAGKSSEYRSYDLGVETLILNAPVNQPSMEQSWGDGEDSKHGFSWKWPVITGGIIISGVALMMTLRWLQPPATPYKSPVMKITDTATEREKSLSASKQMDRVTAAIESYFAAKTVDEMAQYVRLPERVRSMMDQYYANRAYAPTPMADKIPVLEPLPSPEGKNFWVAKCTLKNGQMKNVIAEILPNGTAKVDWENAVSYQPMKLEDFASQKPKGEAFDFQVSIEYGSYYTDEFSDEKVWRCFQISPPNSPSILHGYIKSDSPLAREIDDLIRSNGGVSRRAILRLKFPENFKSERGVLIEKVVSPVWVYLD